MPLVDSFYYLIVSFFRYFLPFTMAFVKEKPLCMIKEKYIVMHIPAATN